METTKRRRRKVGPTNPTLRAHKVRGTKYGYATFDGTERRYGRLDDEAKRLFDADLATWLANGRRFPDDTVDDDAGAAPVLTVGDLRSRYLEHLKSSKSAGWRTNNGPRIRMALDVLAELFGLEPAADFGPRKLKAVRDDLCGLKREDQKTPRLTLQTINSRIHLIRTAFKWAVSDEIVSNAVLAGLNSVEALGTGAPGTRDKRAVQPVEREHVDAVIPYLSTPARALVEIMWWKGARPSELFDLRPCDFDRSGAVWKVRLDRHKTAWKGKRRTLFFGPQCIEILTPFLLRPATRPLFRPVEAVDEQRRRRRDARQTPLYPSHVARYERERAQRPEQEIGETFDAATLRRAVWRAVSAANRHRVKSGLEPIAVWHPYRLRHSAATRIRAAHGVEAARVLLGHTSATMTEVYAEADMLAAAKVMECAG